VFVNFKQPAKYCYILATFLQVVGSPHWKHSELVFEKKALIPALQHLLTSE